MSVPTVPAVPAGAPPLPPGRLGDPAMTLGTDPRADPRMVAVLAGFGLVEHADDAPLTPAAGRAALLGFVTAAEEAFEGLFTAMASTWTPLAGEVERETRTIAGGDGAPITLYVHRPAGVTGPLPCVVQIHGGGMVMLAGEGPLYQRWRDELALGGAVVVGVEYRNGGGRLGPHPYPAGLEDCAAAVRWVAAHRDELGTTHLVLTGDSGGAGLALAVAITARREGWVDEVRGVHALCPYILGRWDDPPTELASLWENDRYWLNRSLFPLLAEVYDPDGAHRDDPGCWPASARAEDLRGLPPHVVVCSELDPLRDEGLAYHRALVAAGVPSVGRIAPGLCHVGELLFREAMPEVYAAVVREVIGFAASVAPV